MNPQMKNKNYKHLCESNLSHPENYKAGDLLVFS